MAAPSFTPKTYVFTYLGLLTLTLGTVLVGFVNLGWGSMFMALLFATMKATLIGCFFMHALVEKRLVKLVIAGALIWFLILISLTLGDYFTRGWLPFPGK